MTETAIMGPVLLTGPTRGLGRATTLRLARQGVPLVLLGRPGPRLEEVAREALAAGAPAATTVPVDLADLASVRRAGDRVAAAVAAGEVAPLGAVVSNAGLQLRDARQVTADGLETTFGVNVIAPHLLLRRLEPALAPGAHVVLVSSGTHYGDRSMGLVAPPRWDDPERLARPDASPEGATPTAGSRAYATSKLAVVHQVHEWQRRRGGALRVNAYDPGLMPGTGLARDYGLLQRVAWRTVFPALRVLPGVTSPTRSARHLADLAVGRAHPGLRGGYVAVGRAEEPSAASFDEEREARLWEVAERLSAAPQA